jgi:hypothetical protein
MRVNLAVCASLLGELLRIGLKLRDQTSNRQAKIAGTYPAVLSNELGNLGMELNTPRPVGALL